MVEKTNENLDSVWLARLQLEYDEICTCYRVVMLPPVFELSRGQRQLGSWKKDTRCIAISTDLIESHSWSVVLQVLKHEMAHQYCDEVAGGGAAHGEGFHRGCEVFGVLPEYRNPSVITGEMLAGLAAQKAGQSKTAQIFARVEKLFALGDSSNIHEAELALHKAQELIEKYQLQTLAGGLSSDYQVLVINTGKKQIATYRRYICRILRDFFSVRVVLSTTYDASLDTSFKTIELLGTRENVGVGEYCFHFLENQLELLWRTYRKKTKASGRTSKNSFYIGVVLGFYKKLEAGAVTHDAAEETVGSNGLKELLVLEQARLDRFVQMHFPWLVKSSSRRSTVDRMSYNEGIAAGKSMNFHKGLKKGAPSTRRLLG